jgi:hypothetical protein
VKKAPDFSGPVAGQSSQEGFTGWKDRKYYMNGQLANGWTQLKPGEENQTMGGLSRTLFKNGVEQDF